MLSERQLAQESGEFFFHLGMFERELNGRLQITLLGAAVIAGALKLIGQHGLGAQQTGNAVGEL